MNLEMEFHAWQQDRNNRDRLKEITERVLGRALRAKKIHAVHLFEHQGGVKPPSKDNFFSIHFNGRANRDADVQDLPSKIWGFSLRRTTLFNPEYLFEPSGKGMVIADMEKGVIVAELIGNNLYILFPLNEFNYVSDKTLLGVYERILKEASILMGGGFPTFSELVSGTFLWPSRKQLLEMESGIKEYRQAINLRIAHGKELENKLETLKTLDEEAEKVLETLLGIPEVKALKVEDQDLIINTHNMYAVDSKTKKIHEFGEFEIRLTFGPRAASAQFRNLTRRPYKDDYGSYGHPHVDRGSKSFWCMGEGRDILHLLETFEFQAAILYALRAINSVNDSGGGNYTEVLRSFPVVEKQMNYPKEKATITKDDRKNFALLFNQTLGKIKADIGKQIASSKEVTRALMAGLLQGTLAEAILKFLYPPQSTTPDKVVAEVVTFLATEINKVLKIPGVKGVEIEEDNLFVRTTALVAKDKSSGVLYSLGPMTLKYDFSTGLIRFVNHDPVRLPGRGIFHAPHLMDQDGELPLGQLTSTLPEILGNLELETAVRLSLDFIQVFSGEKLDLQSWDKFKQTA